MIIAVSPPVHRYPEFAPMFRAEMFDPDEWADLFKKAGAKCESWKLIVWQEIETQIVMLSLREEHW